MGPDQQPQPAEGLTPVPPPPPPQPQWGSAAEAVFHWNQRSWRQEQLEQELQATRSELEALQELLNDLPEIFERKFQSRLQPILEQQQRLLQDNTALRHQLLQLQPQTQGQQPQLLLPSMRPSVGQPTQAGAQAMPATQPGRVRSALRRIWSWPGRGQQAA